jgi:hypothetical protein
MINIVTCISMGLTKNGFRSSKKHYPMHISLIGCFALKEKFSKCIIQFNKLVVNGRCM